jgi:RNA polymerase sigma-70 factor (ECF subfamily)
MWPFRSHASAEPVDDSALRALLPDVRRWIARYVGPRADLDDLVQEAMIEIVVALERFRGDSSVRTYAHRIVLRTTAREIARRRTRARRFELVPDPEAVAGGADPERALSSRRAIEALYAGLDRLSEKRRNAFVLCAIEGVSHEQAAEIEATSVETLRARLKHARADLREHLSREPALAAYFGESS